ncbi:MAG: type II toxin-antitoxin system death-on-curing family toxin [Kiritimatiellaeota bacterium]|nr:type II toxin-antitoxin system death-on-curing family toxin [Kiritimatiellota bacterium]
MKEPLWVCAEVILAVQAELLARFGGIEGLRDEGLLDSAISRPQHLFHYGKPSLFELAAEYAFGIVKNHPFIDGNKRAGFMAAYIFLGANGQAVEAPEDEAVLHTVALAAGEIVAEEYAAWLKASCSKSG